MSTYFGMVLAILLQDRDAQEIIHVARALTLSNEQWQTVSWLVAHQSDLDDPHAPTLAGLKRLMANRGFAALRSWTAARCQDQPDSAQRCATLDARLRAIPPAAVKPPPLVRGDDLLARGVPTGPVYAEVLDALYTRQLDEELTTREDALAALDQLLAERGSANG